MSADLTLFFLIPIIVSTLLYLIYFCTPSGVISRRKGQATRRDLLGKARLVIDEHGTAGQYKDTMILIEFKFNRISCDGNSDYSMLGCDEIKIVDNMTGKTVFEGTGYTHYYDNGDS